MFDGAIISLVICLYILVKGTCTQFYGCDPRRCEVRLRTDAGWVCGRIRAAEDGARYASFRGVPYGKPPLGHRRFQELEPVCPWNILLDATEDAPACPQTDLILGRIQLHRMSEDCIYLNLHVPHRSLPRFPCLANRPGLPILVFIHGGLFQSGAGLTDALGPEYLMNENVIVITFNYRLNIFGFLCLNTKEIPGNQGLRDMVTLLRWVQRNARAFGGDPNNVTLMGQSAGATSAHILSLSKVTKGLFRRVVLMSCTAFPSYYTTSPEYAKKVSGILLQELGINETDPVLIHRKLTQIPLLKLMHANTAVQFKTAIASFNPVVESKFPETTTILDENPLALIAKGRGCEYPQIVSFTNNEMGFARWVIHRKSILPILKQDPTAIVSPRLAFTLPTEEIKEIAEKIGQRYYKGAPTVDGFLKCYSDMFFKYPVFKLAEWRAAAGGAPMYIYQFSYELSHSPIKAAHWVDYRGAAHLDDLSCVFRVNSMLGNYKSYPPKNRDDWMKYWMVNVITNFMKCSNPTCNNLQWPPVSRGKVQYNLISEPMRIQMMEPTTEEMDMVRFCDSFDSESRNITTFMERQRRSFKFF